MVEGVGIDFGTGTSAMAVVREPNTSPQFVKPYPHRDQYLYIESAAAWDAARGGIVVGRRAQRLCIMEKVRGQRPCWPIKPFLGTNQTFELAGEKNVRPQEVAAYVIARLVRRAAERECLTLESLLAAPAVITYPAEADEAQKQATLDAARIVGFRQVFGMIEPHAAAYSFVMSQRRQAQDHHKTKIEKLNQEREKLRAAPGTKPQEQAALTKKLQEATENLDRATETYYRKLEGQAFLVYDFGAGTFDALVGAMRKEADGVLSFTVLGRDGQKKLGGQYITEDFADAILKRRKKEESAGLPILGPEARYDLWETAEEAKIRLSEDSQAKVSTFIDVDGQRVLFAQNWNDLQFKDEVLAKQLDRTVAVCRRAVAEAVLKNDARFRGSDDIKTIFPVGGSSRFSFVRYWLKEAFPKSSITDLGNITFEPIGEEDANKLFSESLAVRQEVGDPITAVVGGAAVAAMMYSLHVRDGTADGRTFLEALGVKSSSSFSLWWNSGGDAEPRLELICDRGQRLPYLHREVDLYPQNPRARSVAWSVWQSALTREELDAQGRNARLCTQIGRIRLRQEPSEVKNRIRMTVHWNDDGEIRIEAIQDGGASFVDATRIPAIFVPTGNLSDEEFSAAQGRVQKYLSSADAGGV